MKHLLRRILKYLAYTAAAAVILLAIAVGLFRLMLPKLPEYQEQIKDWANAAIGLQVEFSGMDARWRLSGPELNFYDARLMTRDGGVTVLNAAEVSVGVGLARLLLDRELVADRILIRDTTVDVSREPDGGWRLQNFNVDDFLESRLDASAGDAGPLAVAAEDIRVNVRQPGRDGVLALVVETMNFRRDARERGLDASVSLPPELGDHLRLSASQHRGTGEVKPPWQLFVEGRALDAAGLSGVWPENPVRFASGTVDLSLWLDLSDGGVRRATANFAMSGVTPGAAPDQQPLSARGRAEFARRETEWLVAANEFVLTTAEGQWPSSTLQLRVSDEPASGTRRIEASASHLDLGDWRYVVAWVPEPYREKIAAMTPSGVLRDLSVSVTRGEGSVAQFDVSSELERAGFAGYGKWPGFRGFTGRLRADQSGGRLEIDARNLSVDLPSLLPKPVDLQRAAGTIIWRHGGDGTTILSDNVRLRNAALDSESSLQITVPAGGASPVVDLQSDWTSTDISAARRYLPEAHMKPALYRWLDNALVNGTVTAGTFRFRGALDRFPFDQGDGEFRIEAHVVDAILRYADNWPAVQIDDLEINLDRTRLWTESNVVASLGNHVVDAKVEIPDLRKPVLTVDASAKGTMESARDFSRQSPIASLFGGQLDHVHVDGDASFDLHFTYPILDRERWAVTTVLRPHDGSVSLEGFPAPVTGLGGSVIVRRDSIRADSLTGDFLGSPVDIVLARVADPDAPYAVIAEAAGTVAAERLIDDLGVPLTGLIDGSTAYDLSIRFPRAGQETPVPVRIGIETALAGMAVRMPRPIGKPAGTERPLSIAIEFPEGDRIESTGSLSDNIRWSVGFQRGANGWDFDRGVLAVGGTAPGEPGSRGLHIEGRTPFVNVDQWLDLARRDGPGPGFGERIRSIDLVVDDLRIIGQRFARHRFIVNRSALDWAVQLDGEQLVGTVSVPYDLQGDRPLVLDMKTLRLAADVADDGEGDEDESDDESRLAQTDPRELPRITVTAEEFSLGTRQLGSLQADFLKTPAGLEARALNAESRSFDIAGSAGWVVDPADPTGQRSYVSARLTSSDVERTLQRLDYQPGIESEAMDIRFDVSWSGGPSEDFLSTLDGDVRVHFGTGQLDEVEPGAGRVFGLMSVVALPRRLSLDFRDVFERGFVFDEITGNFRVQDGEAFTCDLSLKGPSADVGIVGRTGLVAKDYDQAAIVSASVGNTLPVVGAVVAGPQVAAALLIFSQIFKKPLQEMGQIYYGIDGGWANPVIETANPQRFAEAGALAGCIDSAE